MGRVLCVLGLLAGIAGSTTAAEPPVYSHRPNELTFEPREAQYVRFVVRATNNGNQACIDELEVYAPEGDENLALAEAGAEASASSCLGGYAQHAIEHLNDGAYGNERSWIAAGTGEEWAQVKLAARATVAKVVFSRDRKRQYGDRVPTEFDVRLSLDGREWETVKSVKTTAVSGAVGPSGPEPVVPSPPPPPQLAPDGAIASIPAAASVETPTEDALGFENLALKGAKASASSVYADGGVPIHQVAHLNDGKAGNAQSWISKGEPSWAELDLGDTVWIYKVALGNDDSGRHQDRAANSFRILTATEHAEASDAESWTVAYDHGGPPLLRRTEFRIEPVRARWVRIAIDGTAGSEARLDEVEVYGRKSEITVAEVGPIPEQSGHRGDWDDLLRMAFIGEEHAWLKTYGRADLSPLLVPYNGRVTEYPRHVGDDWLPLPPMETEPALDGDLSDACWLDVSRGVARVADPYDFDQSPLVEHVVRAGHTQEHLYLAIRTDRLLSGHVAVIHSIGWHDAAVLAVTSDGLVLNLYTREADNSAKLEETIPVEGAHNADLTRFEVRLPLTAFPECETRGLRVGLGMGGRHTSPLGRPVDFVFAPLALGEAGRYINGEFSVRVAVREAGRATTIAGLGSEAVTLRPGESRVFTIASTETAIGPSADLELSTDAGDQYALHLFRYDPLERTLTMAEEVVERFAAREMDVAAERRRLEGFRDVQRDLLSEAPDIAAAREAFYAARLAKRELFLRDPELAPVERILFVKRHAFHPSHIYTDYTDAPFRPGGGVYVIDIPRREGRITPSEAKLTELFKAEGGIPRDAIADFNLDRTYFGYRPTADGFYHMMSMAADGSDLTQITDGPYHDFYPLPLPDGGIGFITTRCTSRVFCFRWTSSVLFRMNPDGSDIRPLSFSSLSEWAPTVMNDGRIIWTRWEYIDKGADFSQTLWSINPDGTDPEVVFGNTIIQPNGYASGREVPGTLEIACTLVSHFGDINGPVALLDLSKGRFNPKAITSITPEVPWPGNWPRSECFRDPYPISSDLFLVSHAPRDRFGLYVIDRFGNREVLHMDSTYGSMGPIPLYASEPPPALPDVTDQSLDTGEFVMIDVNRGIEDAVAEGQVKWLRVVEEVRHSLNARPNFDHADFMKWYASPVDIVTGPYGWPTYTAKTALGLVPVEEDGSARFKAPAGKVLYFQALDEDYNELQRMRSVIQLQPGETRSCVGCHESRNTSPPTQPPLALSKPARNIEPHPWGSGPFAYERVVQPVLDRACISCHDGGQAGPDLRGNLDAHRVPASYRSLVSGGWVHIVDCGWNSAGCEKREPLTFGTAKSKLWEVLADANHASVTLPRDDMLAIKTWTDLNAPLWPDYQFRPDRPGTEVQVTKAE